MQQILDFLRPNPSLSTVSCVQTTLRELVVAEADRPGPGRRCRIPSESVACVREASVAVSVSVCDAPAPEEDELVDPLVIACTCALELRSRFSKSPIKRRTMRRDSCTVDTCYVNLECCRRVMTITMVERGDNRREKAQPIACSYQN